jgi:hypothetical protein
MRGALHVLGACCGKSSRNNCSRSVKDDNADVESNKYVNNMKN